MNVFVFCVSSSKFQNMHSVVVFLFLENDDLGYKVRSYILLYKRVQIKVKEICR